MTCRRILVSWSSGKDSAWMLGALRQMQGCDIGALLTAINQPAGRVAMHGVRLELVEAQARAVGLPLRVLRLPSPCSNEAYEASMRDAVERAAGEGFTHIAFGDLFLEDVRAYREERLAGSGLSPLFPLWGRPTASLAREMVEAGLKARLTCVDPRVLDRSLAGLEFDLDLLEKLGPEVDRCGERGEFHTFAYDGPMFDRPVPIRAGTIVERDGFVFADFVGAREQD